MTQFRFRGSVAFAACCTGRPLSSAFPNSPEWSTPIVARHSHVWEIVQRGLTRRQHHDIIMKSRTTSQDIKRCDMLWYNFNPEVVRLVTAATPDNDDGRRRDVLGLIGRPGGR